MNSTFYTYEDNRAFAVLSTKEKNFWLQLDASHYEELFHVIDIMKDKRMFTYCAHEWIKNTDSESSTTSERLRHVEFSVGIIVVILIEKLDIGVITCIRCVTQQVFPTNYSNEQKMAVRR